MLIFKDKIFLRAKNNFFVKDKFLKVNTKHSILNGLEKLANLINY